MFNSKKTANMYWLLMYAKLFTDYMSCILFVLFLLGRFIVFFSCSSWYTGYVYDQIVFEPFVLNQVPRPIAILYFWKFMLDVHFSHTQLSFMSFSVTP